MAAPLLYSIVDNVPRFRTLFAGTGLEIDDTSTSITIEFTSATSDLLAA